MPWRFEGHSIRHWVAAKLEPDSRFVAFDTFTGLPEAWNAAYSRGHFDTGGGLPAIPDAGVSFRSGLFQATLGAFLADDRTGARPLVVNLDRDLYASALYRLTRLSPCWRPARS